MTRDELGQIAYETFLNHAREQVDNDPDFIFAPWDQLWEKNKEKYRKLGEAVAKAVNPGFRAKAGQRVVQISASAEWMASHLVQGVSITAKSDPCRRVELTSNGLPAGAKIVAIIPSDNPNYFQLVAEHKSFEPLEEGAEPPIAPEPLFKMYEWRKPIPMED